MLICILQLNRLCVLYQGWARLGSKKEQSFLLIYKAWSADITNQQPWAVDTRPWSH
ncbi:hypothetical protein Plhal304r1_c018g0064701 [Plasmopara halstedii]